MSVTRSTRKAPMRLVDQGDTYLALIDANHRTSVVERMRADREHHQATRPCVVCDVPMVDGACSDHGRPGEDRGEWLWAK